MTGYGVVTVGRDAECMYRIPDPYVSKQHCRFVLDGGVVYVEDLGSANGTYVDGQRIEPGRRTPVRSGSRVTAGTRVQLDVDYVRSLLGVGAGTPVYPQSGGGYPAQQHGGGVPVGQGYGGPPPHQGQDFGGAQQKSIGREFEYALQANKSYVGAAWSTWFLYSFGWIASTICALIPPLWPVAPFASILGGILGIIGIIMNIVYLNQASQTGKIVGRNPSGHGCLWALLIVYVFIPIALTVILLIVGGSILSSIFGRFGNAFGV
jgi:hypothetical protein